MLGQRPFWFGLIRKYTALFGTLFNEIRVQQFSTSGDAVTQEIRVPLTYADKDKMLARLRADPQAAKPVEISLPRMSFRMGDPVYDPDRALNQVGGSVLVREGGVYRRQYNPVPYNFPFKLWVYVKNIEDGNKIVEQILPAFRPEFPVTAELVPEMEETRDLAVVLESVSRTDDATDGALPDRRMIVWELGFVLKGFLYGPVHEHPVIKFANVSLYDATRHETWAAAIAQTAAIDRVTAQPGMLANGSPTTNAAASVAYSEIEEEDDWGYAIVIYGSLVPSDIGGGEGADEPITKQWLNPTRSDHPAEFFTHSVAALLAPSLFQDAESFGAATVATTPPEPSFSLTAGGSGNWAGYYPSLSDQMGSAMKSTRSAGVRAATVLAESYAAMASGVLVGLSEALTGSAAPAPAAKKAAPRKR